jgi:biopolymer transport protein ExbD
MNRQQLTYFRVVALIMAGLVATLTVCNLFTIATKGISVNLPTEEDIHWSVDPLQKEILFRTSFSVRNQGVYDISDIDISAQLVKDDMTPLYSFEKKDLVVLRGSNTTFDLLIPFDLDKISFFDWFSLMYKNTTLQLLLDIDAQYMFGLVEFTANEAIDVPWSSPLDLSDNTTVQTGVQGLCTLLNISQNTSIASLSDIISLFSLPQVSYTAESGFAFSLNISSYSETVKNITCHVIVPLLVIDGCFEFSVSILVGFEAGSIVFRIQEAGIEYVI